MKKMAAQVDLCLPLGAFLSELPKFCKPERTDQSKYRESPLANAHWLTAVGQWGPVISFSSLKALILRATI